MSKLKQLFGFDEAESETPIRGGESIFSQLKGSLFESWNFMTNFPTDFIKNTAKDVKEANLDPLMEKFSSTGTIEFKRDGDQKDEKPKDQFGQVNRQTIIQSQILNAQLRKEKTIKDVARFEVYGMSQADKNKRLNLSLDYASEHTDDIYHASELKEDVTEDIKHQEKQERAADAAKFQATGQIDMRFAMEGGAQKGGPNISATGGGVG